MTATIWAVLGLALILAEFAVPQFVVFFFGLGALLNALLVALVPGLNGRVPLQILLWAATSGISLAVLRRYAAGWFRGSNRSPQESASADAGRTATVIETIAPDQPGRIRFHGTSWTATAVNETIPEGATVTILEKRSLTYLVTAGNLLDEDSFHSGDSPKERKP